ncbi:MAG: pilus assembly protein N-terminal domain-containing protein [Eubacterium sp.]|nr:pilus assembly protein N-terminal domain-containing protein [Eubacterium sp.]
MKKKQGKFLRFKRIIAINISCILLLFSGNISAEKSSAKKADSIELSKSSLTVQVDKTKAVKTSGSFSEITICVKDPEIAEAVVSGKRIVVRGKKVGITKIKVKGYDRKKLVAKGKIKVRVEEKQRVIVEDEYALTSIHSGEATFYDPGESCGAACLDDFSSDYFTAAMNTEDYLNGLAGAYIEVTDKDGDVVNVLITDRLPGGVKGDIDLSEKAFESIEPMETGRMDITWRIIALPTDEPVSFMWKPTRSQYWAQVQVRNHRYPILSLEYYDTEKGEFVPLNREEYNYFTAPDGMGGTGPFIFRITDIYGQEIIEENVKMKSNEKPFTGSSNFPVIAPDTEPKSRLRQ